MKKTNKLFSIFLCLIMAVSFAIIPMTVWAEPDTPPDTTAPTTAKTTAATTASTTAKTTASSNSTTKRTSTTARKTTSGGNSSGTGKLSISSRRSDEGSGAGGKVKVIYTIENSGSVRATNIKLRDSDIAGSQTIASIDSLASGDSKTIEYEATMTRDSTSTPTVTCTMNGASRTFTGESVKISLTGSSSLLSATLTTSSTDVQPNTPIRFSLLIKNDDTNRVTDIAVTDYAGKAIKSGINLDAGSSTNVDFELTLTGDTNVYVTVSGKGSSGNTVSSRSNEVAMKASANAVSVNEGLSILLYADKTSLEKSGEVKLTLEVKNLMPRAYTNVSIVDKSTGTNLQTLSLLSGNDSKTYDSTITVSQNTSFLYEATATYEDGTAVTVQSNSLEIKVGSSGKLSGSMLVIVIIVVVVIVLIIATSITLYVLSKKENEKKKSLGAAQSEKYRKSTPKKKSRGPAPAPPKQPMSSFTIDDNNMDTGAPSFDTSPIQIPKADNAFDNYGENLNFDSNNLEHTNPTQIYNGDQEFNAFANTQHSQPMSSNEFNQVAPERHEQPEESYIAPEESYIPQPEPEPEQPRSNEPMNYNDLDPD